MDFSTILATLANTLIGLTKAQQEEVSKSFGMAAGNAVRGTKNKIDDAVFLNVVIPNARIMLDTAEATILAPVVEDPDPVDEPTSEE